MPIFAKKPDWGEVALTPQPAPSNTATHKPPTYRIADAIQLMRGLPIDQNPDLIVSVVRATLASLNVRLPDIIDDAARKEKTVQESISAFHAQIAELEKQLDARRREIAAAEADLKETTEVKQRLQMAERAAAATPKPFIVPSDTTPMPGARPPAPNVVPAPRDQAAGLKD